MTAGEPRSRGRHEDQSRSRHSKASLPTWRVILAAIRYRPWLWLANLGAVLIMMLTFQVPGLLLREFFNLLTGEAQSSLGLWSIIALLIGSQVARTVATYGTMRTNVPFFVHTMT